MTLRIFRKSHSGSTEFRISIFLLFSFSSLASSYLASLSSPPCSPYRSLWLTVLHRQSRLVPHSNPFARCSSHSEHRRPCHNLRSSRGIRHPLTTLRLHHVTCLFCAFVYAIFTTLCVVCLSSSLCFSLPPHAPFKPPPHRTRLRRLFNYHNGKWHPCINEQSLRCTHKGGFGICWCSFSLSSPLLLHVYANIRHETLMLRSMNHLLERTWLIIMSEKEIWTYTELVISFLSFMEINNVCSSDTQTPKYT